MPNSKWILHHLAAYLTRNKIVNTRSANPQDFHANQHIMIILL